MPKNVELLLTESVEALGIVGDVVKVRTGYARNFLLPRGFATEPSEDKVKELAGKRAEAERQLAELRKSREALVQKLDGYLLELIRSCNDMGILYGGITQGELATALGERGFAVKPRDVRLSHAVKRVGQYEVHVKFASDLEATVKLDVKPDRKLDLRDDDEPAEDAAAAGETPPEAAADAEAGEKKKSKKSKDEAPAAKEPKAEKPAKGEKSEKGKKA
ncbi:MAG: 50S ribosomal protein L9 [Phycisphaeraceae bacterium]|nr:50S ribosomal protein L9 [Phycisphaeraceae bacterium]